MLQFVFCFLKRHCNKFAFWASADNANGIVLRERESLQLRTCQRYAFIGLQLLKRLGKIHIINYSSTNKIIIKNITSNYKTEPIFHRKVSESLLTVSFNF